MPETTTRRRPLVIGNWKMHMTPLQAAELAVDIALGFPRSIPCFRPRVGVAPPFPALVPVAEALSGSPVELLAQDAFHQSEGAYTGAVSAPMLAASGCSGVLVGHSERRHLFGETDAEVRKKTQAVLAIGMMPVLCVGETAAQRDAGQAETVAGTQLEAVLDSLAPSDLKRLVIAYEPVWAIGTGRTATPETAEAMHRAIRRAIAGIAGADEADRMAILYGGSVKGDNAAAIMAGANVDGVLVGGASLRADSFLSICRAAG